uniref:UNC93-like protein MFSD11 n=1 Tax=Sphenodon punctatus TaxID=8508 RepID=A0A8D0GKF1_SPHPU
MSPESKNLFNIIILGLAFMFMFTAFQTCGNVEQTIITNLNNTHFHGSGYTSMAIIYVVFSASNLISPSVVALIGPQLAMFISGIFYSIYIAVFIEPVTWAFYTASVFLGIAAAVVWTAQGNCLTINSDENTIGRNSGIFWALLQSSLFFGNLYIYFAWKGKKIISASDRRTVFIALTVISLVGTVLFFLIRKPAALNSQGEEDSANNENTCTHFCSCLFLSFFPERAIKLSTTKEILLLSITTAYTGNGMARDTTWVQLFTLISLFLYSKEVAIFCSFLLGFGDSCFNTQLLSILGFLFSENSAPAFAIFKFIQSICAAVAFFYSNYLLLQWQLLIMAVVGFFGTMSFFTVEWEAAAFVARGSDYSSI